jgi:hypothetical protein
MYLRHVPAVLAAGLLLPAAAQSSSPLRVEISVRIYQRADLPAAARQAAMRIAGEALAAAGVAVSWRECDAACAVPDAGELIVRLLRAADASTGIDRRVLGDAFVDIAHANGVLATIYVDHVAQLAEASASDMAMLLGRAIAHELGHLLLATNTHSTRGLMRAKWTRDDLRRERPVDWRFTEEDAQAMRERLR